MGSIRPDPNLLKKHPNAVTLDQLQEKDRFLGALLGAAAGEALGAPHEGKPAGEVGPVREITGGGPWAAGEPTDDIDLTLALLRSLVARRKFDQDDAARRYLEWFSRGPKDVGLLTRAALENLRAGDPPQQASALAWEDSGRRAAGSLPAWASSSTGSSSRTGSKRVWSEVERSTQAVNPTRKCAGPRRSGPG